jgi:flagellin
MALNSINSNAAALIALQNLNVTNQTLQDTQNRISTGQKVSSAKDNGAIYAIAQNLRAQNSAFDAVKDSLNRGVSTVDVALSAGNSISSALSQLKQLALSASDTSLDTNSRAAFQAKYQQTAQQIQTYLKNANFNGVNLLNGTTASYSALANTNGQNTITVQGQNLSLNTNFTGGAAATLSTQTGVAGPQASNQAANSTTSFVSLSQASSFTITVSGSTTASQNATFQVNLAAGAYSSSSLAAAINTAYTNAGGTAASIVDGTTTAGKLILKGTNLAGAAGSIAFSNGAGDLSSSLSTFLGGLTANVAGASTTETNVLGQVALGTVGAALSQTSTFTLTTDAGNAFTVSLGAGFQTANNISTQINNAYNAAGYSGSVASVNNGKIVLTGIGNTPATTPGTGITGGSGDLASTAATQQFLGFNSAAVGSATVAAASATTNGVAATAFSETGGGGLILVSGNETFSSTTNYTDLLSKLDTSIANVNQGLSALGVSSTALSNHLTFVSTLQDTLNTGVSNLVDADVAKESATLQALQTKQQLGIQALSIANSSKSSLLSLFR